MNATGTARIEETLRPSIFALYWPAILGWGTIATCLAVRLSWLYRPADEDEVDLFRFLMAAVIIQIGVIVSPLTAVLVTLLCRHARRPLPLVVNFLPAAVLLWLREFWLQQSL